MRTGKILGLTLGALLALTVMVALALWLLVNPNEYKGRIAAAVSKATGRELVLKGDVGLSVFPWLALELGPGSLGNPPEFAAPGGIPGATPSAGPRATPGAGPSATRHATPLLTFQHARVRLRLLPLLEKRLEAALIEIDGLDLELATDAAGRGNWQSAAPSASADGSGKPPQSTVVLPSDGLANNNVNNTSTSAAGAGSTAGPSLHTLVLTRLAGIHLTHSRVHYQTLTLDDIDLETGAFTGQGVVPVTLHVTARNGDQTATSAIIDAQFDVATDGASVTGGAKATGGANADHGTAAARDRTTVPSIATDRTDRATASEPATDGATISSTAPDPATERSNVLPTATNSSAQRLRIAALSLTASLSLRGHVQPQTVRLTAPSIKTDLAAQTLIIPAFAVSADGADLTGSLNATRIVADPHVDGNFKLAPLVLREWLMRIGVTPPATRDAKTLSLLTASGAVVYADHALHLQTLKATLDDTNFTGRISLDNMSKRAVSFDLEADGVDLDRYRPPATQLPAAHDDSPVPDAPTAPSPPWVIDGRFAVGQIQVAGLELSQVDVTVMRHDGLMRLHPLTATVDGGQYSGDINVDHRGTVPIVSLDEHLTGVDLSQLLAAQKLKVSGRGNVTIAATGHGAGADALVKTLTGHFDLSVGPGSVEGVDVSYELERARALLRGQTTNAANTRRTPFDRLRMSADITNGHAITQDLLIAAPIVKITGAGTVDLPTQSLDLGLLADTQMTLGASFEVPLKITGSFQDPQVRPDIAALAKSELKDHVKEVLREKLKGLFGRP